MISGAAHADIVGRASVIDGDTIEYMDSASGFTGSMRRRKDSPASTLPARSIAVDRLPRWLSMNSSARRLSLAASETQIATAARSRTAVCGAKISRLGLFGTGTPLHIGAIRATTSAPSRKRRTQRKGYGPARRSRLGNGEKIAEEACSLTLRSQLARRAGRASRLLPSFVLTKQLSVQ